MDSDRFTEQTLREQVVDACRLLHLRNLIAATDGNISARLGDTRLLATPSGVSKGLIRAEDLVVTDMAGQAQAGVGSTNGLKPSAELRMHLEIYRQRPDVRAVVHAHPPVTTAMTVAGVSLAPCVLPETLVTIGTIATTQYATPTSSDVPAVVRDLIRQHDALVLDRHGAVTVGTTVMEAYAKMEKVENTAVVLALARMLGQARTLPLDEVRRLSDMRNAMLAPARSFRGPDCEMCRQCPGLDGRGATVTAR